MNLPIPTKTKPNVTFSCPSCSPIIFPKHRKREKKRKGEREGDQPLSCQPSHFDAKICRLVLYRSSEFFNSLRTMLIYFIDMF